MGLVSIVQLIASPGGASTHVENRNYAGCFSIVTIIDRKREMTGQHAMAGAGVSPIISSFWHLGRE